MRKKGNWPCRTCYERKPGCHSDCERYMDHKELISRDVETERANRDIEGMVTNYEATRNTDHKVY